MQNFCMYILLKSHFLPVLSVLVSLVSSSGALGVFHSISQVCQDYFLNYFDRRTGI